MAEPAIYHRLNSPTQTLDTAIKQQQSLEIWGKARGNGGSFPVVKAYSGPLPPNQSGIEFETDIEPDQCCGQGQSGQVMWYGFQEEVEQRGDFAILKVLKVTVIYPNND